MREMIISRINHEIKRLEWGGNEIRGYLSTCYNKPAICFLTDDEATGFLGYLTNCQQKQPSQ
jgi:hypothetical protein